MDRRLFPQQPSAKSRTRRPRQLGFSAEPTYWKDASDTAASIAQWHRLRGVVERYLIIDGSGLAQVGESIAQPVGPGDVVVIPSEVRQRIENTGTSDLVFYCICSPRFTPDCYESLE